MRAMVVEVRHVFVQHRRKMAAVNDQDPVQQFAAEVPTLWVPNWPSTSCDQGVFAYQPAEPITTSQVTLGW